MIQYRTDFFTALVLGAPATLAPAGLMALLMSQPKYEVPTQISGFINDDHVHTESTKNRKRNEKINKR